MNKTINIIIRFFIIFVLIFESTYASDTFVCSQDPVYKDYKAGNRLNLDGATHYAGETICENNCRQYQACVADSDTPGSYYCPIKRYQDVGGDVTPSNFSNQTTCNGICYVQNYCATIHPTDCVPVNISYSDSVTDYTGKELYTKRTVTLECNSTTTQQTGCNKWKVSSTTASVDYNTSGVGTIYKEQTEGGDKAQSLAAMLEQQLHLFSGWAGQCEHGTMFNNPFSDPMAILGYAMMVYSAAGKGALGETAQEAHKAVNDTFDAIGNKVKDLNPFGEAASTTTASNEVFIANHTIDTAGSITKDLASMNEITTWKTGTKLFGDVKILYTDIAKIAMSLIPTDEEVQQADDFNKVWMGDADADDQALAYANCMASIGLSFPNLVSFSAADINNSSPELQNVHSNPIRLTTDQIAILMSATSETYVENDYYPIDYDKSQQIVTYLARDQLAYQQAGQVICSGKLAVSSNIVAHDETKASTSGGKVGTAVAKAILGQIPGIWGIVACVVLDIVTSLKSGDACHDADIATQWGLIQLKTNKFLNFDQCHHTGSECAAKWFWGSCMRTREKYCCYDQISTRIFAEGIKMEMYPAIDPETGLENKHMWEKCDDITIDDLKNISFKKCEIGEDPYKDHCFPISKYNEFSDSIKKSGVTGFDFQSAANQAMNSLAIPGGEICTTH